MSNGFQINEAKVRLSDRKVRQEVTGLIVNERINVKRRFIREIRAMLHAWRKFGIENAQIHFSQKYNGSTQFEEALRGKIEFVAQVRGRPDETFRRLAHQFNKLSGGAPIRTLLTKDEIARQAIWVIESDGDIQGTAFFIRPGEIATCSHSVGLNPHIYHPANHSKKFKVNLKKDDAHRDLAIFTAPADLMNVIPLEMYQGNALADGTSITLFGYPNHLLARPIRVEGGSLIRTFPSSAVSYFEITNKIIGGNSGGPLLNNKYEVVGVAVRGLNGNVPLNQAEFLAINGKELIAIM